MKKIKLLSLFSGQGAFEKALTDENIDYEIVNYCEIEKFPSCAYSVIHNVDEELNLWDVRKIDTRKLPEYDLLTFGFPCQDISLAGKMKGIVEGETRSGLLYEALRIIKDTKPKFAICENVKNLASKLFKKDLDNMLSILEDLGYKCYFKVLNASNFAAPTLRERVFIVMVRNDIHTKEFKFPKEIPSNIVLKDIMDPHVDEKYYCDNTNIREFLNKIKRKVVDNRQPTKNRILKVGDLNDPKSLEMNKRIFSENSVSPTLLTSSYNSPKVLIHKVRKLTPLECWRITGFTDEDYWKVRRELENRFYNGKDKSDSQMYKMAGNGIVVKVAQAIFKELFKTYPLE